jgi:hypothetical protein
MCVRSRAIERRTAAKSFSGASDWSDCTVGSSTLMLSRSAYRPAWASNSSLASGIVFRWM